MWVIRSTWCDENVVGDMENESKLSLVCEGTDNV